MQVYGEDVVEVNDENILQASGENAVVTVKHCANLRRRCGDVAQLVEHRTVTPLTQVRFPGAARDFSPRVNFQCRLSYVCPYNPVCNRMH